MIKIGIIDYINSIPFSHGLENHGRIIRGTPAQLAEKFLAGALDVSFIPSVAYLSNPNCGVMVEGVSISSFGATNSVFLHSTTEINKIRTVSLSPESKTSNFITREILEGKYGITPRYVENPEIQTDAHVIIGDNALKYVERPFKILDVGYEWMDMTGLPMVYAVCVAKSANIAKKTGAVIRQRRDSNMINIKSVLAENGALKYLPYILGLDYCLEPEQLKTLQAIRSMINNRSEMKYDFLDNERRRQIA